MSTSSNEKALSNYLLTPNELANELCSLNNCSCILVEGETDAYFWKHIRNDYIKVYTANNKVYSCNKEYVIHVINEINTRKRTKIKISGIVDFDYDYVLNNIQNLENLYYYKYHDFEITLIKSNAFNLVNERISSKDKFLSSEVIRKILFNIAYPIGLIRLINDKEKMGIDFKIFKIEKLLNYNENQILQYFYSVQRLTKKEIEAFYKIYCETKDMNYLPEYICNGHDVMRILSSLTVKRISNDNPVVFLEEVLTCLLSAEYFSCYKLENEQYLTCNDLIYIT